MELEQMRFAAAVFALNMLVWKLFGGVLCIPN
jgi:hypothetical protein